MTGGYPCCCQERFGSSISGAESGQLPSSGTLPPGSFLPPLGSLGFVYCAAFCDKNRAPARVRIDVELARVPVSIQDCPGDRCDEQFNGTYFLENESPFAFPWGCTCIWYHQYGNERQFIYLCLKHVFTSKLIVRVDILVSDICSTGFDVTAGFLMDLDTDCITLEQLHGLVVPVDPSRTACQPPQGKATVYVV